MRTIRKAVIATGLLSFMVFTWPNHPMLNMTTITAMAAEQTTLPYSRCWETQSDGSWKYKLNNGTYATGWIQDEVDLNWYYMDSNGIMQSGLYQSYGKYYLLSEVHDGHFGHMLKNGEAYKNVTIIADVSVDSEGALSQETISNLGLDVSTAPDISGSQHVTDGEVVSPAQPESESSGMTSSERRQAQRDKYGEGAEFSVDDDDHPLSGGNNTNSQYVKEREEAVKAEFGGDGTISSTGEDPFNPQALEKYEHNSLSSEVVICV